MVTSAGGHFTADIFRSCRRRPFTVQRAGAGPSLTTLRSAPWQVEATDGADVLKEIRRRGFEPAIWVAPFIAQANSHVIQRHPDWFNQTRGRHPSAIGRSDLRRMAIRAVVLGGHDAKATRIEAYRRGMMTIRCALAS
jgi:hypothetical protein